VQENIKIIIDKCLKDDRLAQKTLFESMAPRLLTVSRQYAPKGCDPLDNLQDAFIKIFKYLNTYNEQNGSFDAWARRIVINTALSKLNKKTIVEVISNFQDYDFEDIDLIASNDNIKHLMEVIEQLPDGYKQVFCLYEIEGYSHKEIGNMLNIKEATSRSQLNRSKLFLRDMLLRNEKPTFIKLKLE
jgi:RNA polymerase sigma factor (sigma-70 family)